MRPSFPFRSFMICPNQGGAGQIGQSGDPLDNSPLEVDANVRSGEISDIDDNKLMVNH